MQRTTRSQGGSSLSGMEALRARAQVISQSSAEVFDPKLWLEVFKYSSSQQDGDSLRALRKSILQGVYAACAGHGASPPSSCLSGIPPTQPGSLFPK